MRRILFTIFIACVIGVSTGCRNCCKRPFFGDGGLFNRGGSGARLGSPAPLGSDPLLIPPPVGGLPSTVPPDAQIPAPQPGLDLPPPSIPEARESNKPPETRNGKELILPDPLPGTSKLEAPALLGPEPSTSRAMPSPTKSVTGITGFTLVRDGIATGRKPSLDGFDKLQQAGYKTVVYLHEPDADVSAAKTLAEKRNLTFLAIPVGVAEIKPSLSRFSEIVGDSAAKPIYIFDDDGSRTGTLWYGYFRTVDGLSQDASEVRAAPLGLRDAPTAEKDRLWAAMRDYLLTR